MSEEGAGNRIAERSAGNLAPMILFYRTLLSLKVEDPNFEALEPEGRKFGTFEAVKNLLLALSEEKPLVIFLEDAHWIDKISEEFFTFFARCMTDHPILMLAAYRPEGAPPWTQSAHYQRLGLETLSSKSSIRLVHNILDGLALDPDLERKIVEKTGGNPFFVEEIVRELRERGDIVKADDRYIYNRPIDQLEIPNTIQGVLAARMDRLGEDLKRTMQVASVIGRDFAFRILKSITELGGELRTSLSNLVGLEILYEKALFPELEYIFKHALTQEVAYESLLKQRRQEIHERIAQAIEELYPDRLEEHYELLAHHYERSCNAFKAVDYLILAGEKSNHNNAVQASYEFFRKCIEIVESKDIALDAESEVRLHHGWATSNQGIGAIGESVKTLRKTIGLSQRHGMIDYERRSLSLLGSMMFIWPDRAEAERIIEDGITRAKEIEDKPLESYMLSWAGTCEFCYGSPYKGHQILVEAERIGMEVEDPISIFHARVMRGWPERWLGKPAKTIELTAGQLEVLSGMFNFGLFTKAIQNRGVALAEVGRIEEGVAILKHAIDISEKFGPFLPHASFFNSLGYCYSEIYQHEKAWSLNLRSEEIASEFLEKYPLGRLQYAEIAAQARVNLMENLFDQGKIDEAWNRMESLKEESNSDDYNMVRYVWESRMNYLAAQIVLHRNELGRAEALIQKDLERVRTKGTKKREGGFLRLLGEVQISRNESENAIENFNEAIVMLAEVGNPRQLWQAHVSLASAYEKLGRANEARNQWGEAAKIIRKTSNGLSDRELREGFLEAKPIREILSKAES
ncbi:MAG: hypothetical protein H8E17_03720 [Deltaproteobacteria bacterium]|nr:hypothetical protein [Deltaproteobacteria bacterium]